MHKDPLIFFVYPGSASWRRAKNRARSASSTKSKSIYCRL